MARRFRAPPVVSNLGLQGRVHIPGLREYCQKLGQLGENMALRGCVYALNSGAEVMMRAVRLYTPVLKNPDPRREPGTLRNAVQKMHVGDHATKYDVTYVVGIRLLSGLQIFQFKRMTGRGSTENPRDPFYGTILEYGKTPRTRHPFMKPGFEASADAAVKISGQRLGEFTMIEIKRLAALGGQYVGRA